MKSSKVLITYISRYIGVVILVVTSIAAVGIVWKYIVPKVQEVQTMREEIETLKKKRTDLATYVQYLNQLASSTLEIEQALVNYALPSENDVISLIVTYEGLSKTEGVDVSPFSFTPGLIRKAKTETDTTNQMGENGAGESTSPEIKPLDFTMEVSTEKSETALNFIQKIHNTRRVFSIKSLTWKNPLVTSSSQGTDNEITISMNISTFYYPKAPQVLGSADLVNKGKTQTAFIDKLNQTMIFDSLVLDSVQVGKQDFFTLDDTVIVPTKTIKKDTEATLSATPSAFPGDF
jgi:hypothetical protein